MLLYTLKNAISSDKNIILPSSLTLSCESNIFNGIADIFSPLAEKILCVGIAETNCKGFINIKAATLEDEEYSLEITEGGVSILASTKAGALYA